MTLRKSSLTLLALIVLYLAAWPVDVRPAAFSPGASPALAGPFAANGKLGGYELLAPDLPGPEAAVIDARGTLYTGLLDGRVVAIEPGGAVRTIAKTAGRPLGLRFQPDGSLVAAIVRQGIAQITLKGDVTTLVAREGERAITFADDVDVLPDGRLVFSEATTRFPLESYELDAVEHGQTGSVFVFDPRDRSLRALARGLSFPNGVAAHPDGSYVLVNETWNYRVLRLWLSGPKRGTREVFADNLPGFPDNVTYDAERRLFWVALGSPRDAGLDLLGPFPRLRTVIARLPKALRPQPKRHAMLVALDEAGRVVHFFDDPRPESYSPLTGVLATRDALYLTSYQHRGVGRVATAALGLR